MVPELQGIAVFSIARHFWKKHARYRCEWDTITREVIESISVAYPYLPPPIKNRIVHIVSWMGNDHFIRFYLGFLDIYLKFFQKILTVSRKYWHNLINIFPFSFLSFLKNYFSVFLNFTQKFL